MTRTSARMTTVRKASAVRPGSIQQDATTANLVQETTAASMVYAVAQHTPVRSLHVWQQTTVTAAADAFPSMLILARHARPTPTSVLMTSARQVHVLTQNPKLERPVMTTTSAQELTNAATVPASATIQSPAA